MSKQQAYEFLADGTRTGRLATASTSGEPHVAPVWFVLDGDDLVFTTWHRSVKARHLRANPRAALTVDVAEFPYHFVAVRGPVTVQDAATDLRAWAGRIAARYVPADRVEEYAGRNAVPGELLCRLRPEHVTGHRAVAD